MSGGLDDTLIRQDDRFYYVFTVYKTLKRNMTHHAITVYNRMCIILTFGKFVAVPTINKESLYIYT